MAVKLHWSGYLWNALPETVVSPLWWEFKVMFYTIGSCFNLSGAIRNALWQPLILDVIVSASGFLTLTPTVPSSSGLFARLTRSVFHYSVASFSFLFSIFCCHRINCHHYRSSKLVHAFSQASKKKMKTERKKNDTRPKDILVEFRAGYSDPLFTRQRDAPWWIGHKDNMTAEASAALCWPAVDGICIMIVTREVLSL